MATATIIVGAGIVGVSTAYYLSEHQPPGSIHLVETTDALFASASGYAGGFLARDWFAADVAELAALSFDQHRALADRYDGRTHWGYAESTSLSYGMPEAEAAAAERKRGEDWLRQGTSRSTAAPSTDAAESEGDGLAGKLPAWLHRRAGDRVEVLADDGTTGQVDPFLFCQFLLRVCQDRGVQLHQPARVVSVGTDEHGELATVSLETGIEGPGKTLPQTVLPCTRLIITAGAWTPRVFAQLFSSPTSNTDADLDDRGRQTIPVTNYAGHSLVVRVPRSAPSCYALFAAGSTLGFCPEIFGRANGTLYLAGLNSSTTPLPHRATDAVPQQEKLDDLLKTCKRVLGVDETTSSSHDSDIEFVRTGLCHRPATPWGVPLVLRLPDEQLQGGREDNIEIKTKPGAAGGVFVAAGHGPWGISMGPGTGMVLAELVQGRPLSADLGGLGVHR